MEYNNTQKLNNNENIKIKTQNFAKVVPRAKPVPLNVYVKKKKKGFFFFLEMKMSNLRSQKKLQQDKKERKQKN